MLRPRIIPSLLVHKGGLVKTTGFKNSKYIGDPINAVKIFNEKEADELAVFDIDASVMGVEPNYQLINNLAQECRMPLCYGGGIKTVDQAKRIIDLGVEKIALSSGAIANMNLVSEIASAIGNQSVVVVMDVSKKKRLFGRVGSYQLSTHNGTIFSQLDPLEFASAAQRAGAGEIVINSIDNDGQMKGYDFDIVRLILEKVSIPITVLGGAGSLKDISNLIGEFGLIGAAAGSLFLFKGPYRAVLINYPTRAQKDELFLLNSTSISGVQI